MTSRPLMVGPMIHLGMVAPFRDLSQYRLASLALEAEEVVFEAESWLVRATEPVTAMHVIVDGYVRSIARDGADTLGPGGVVGFPHFLVPEATGASARTDTEVVAFRIETDALRDLCERDFAILAALLSHLAATLVDDPDALARIVEGAPEPTPLPPGVRLDRVGRMLTLQRSPAFAADHMDALAELAGQVSVSTLDDGDTLCEPGHPADTFWVAASGVLDLSVDGRPPVRVGPGSVAGFPEALAGAGYRCRGTALGQTTVLAVAMDPFMDVIEDHFELAFSLLAWLARHVTASERTPSE